MKYFLAIISFFFVAGCATPQKAIDWGVGMSKLSDAVQEQAKEIRDDLEPEQQEKLRTAVLHTVRCLEVYNNLALAWFYSGEKPEGLDSAKQRFVKAIETLYNFTQEVRK